MNDQANREFFWFSKRELLVVDNALANNINQLRGYNILSSSVKIILKNRIVEIALLCFNERKIIFFKIRARAINSSSDEHRVGEMWLYLQKKTKWERN